jgi:hypothetical protein
MSGITILLALIQDHAPLLDAVPFAKIMGGPIPQKTAPPCIGLTVISGVDRNILHAGSKVTVRERIQATVMAADYDEVKAIIKLLRAACRDRTGTIAGFTNCSVLSEGVGPDFSNPTNGLFMQPQDFSVSYRQPVN